LASLEGQQVFDETTKGTTGTSGMINVLKLSLIQRNEKGHFIADNISNYQLYSTAALANQGVAIQRVITYLLMATYCAEEYGERVNMKRGSEN